MSRKGLVPKRALDVSAAARDIARESAVTQGLAEYVDDAATLRSIAVIISRQTDSREALAHNDRRRAPTRPAVGRVAVDVRPSG